MISVGDAIPSATVGVIQNGQTENQYIQTLLAGKKVVLFALPGAFTPTCSNSHLPGYVVKADEIKAKGVDMIACLSVNDSFVMNAWGQSQNAEALTLIADGAAALTTAMGLEKDTGDFGGIRSQRYAMIIDDGIVSLLNVEAPKEFTVSDADSILAAL